MQSQTQRIRVNESVVAAEVDNEMVLLNVETGIYFGLDAVGTRIWSLLTSGAGKQTILSCLLAEYDVEPDRLQADLTEFVELLAVKGLLHARDE